MPLPESKRVLYKHNPLAEVICQLQFSPILEIGVQDPVAFQNKVRGMYPEYQREDAIGHLPRGVAELLGQIRVPRIEPAEAVTHKFALSDFTRFISLSGSFVAVTEQRYRRWEQFRREVELAKTAVEEVYNPVRYVRIGLRYQNLIDPSKLGLPGESWDRLVNPALAGILGSAVVQDDVQEAMSNALLAVSEVQGGFVRLRHGLVRTGPTQSRAYLIDADFFTQEMGAIDHGNDVLDSFNRLAGNLFRWAITPRLQSALAPGDID